MILQETMLAVVCILRYNKGRPNSSISMGGMYNWERTWHSHVCTWSSCSICVFKSSDRLVGLLWSKIIRYGGVQRITNNLVASHCMKKLHVLSCN